MIESYEVEQRKTGEVFKVILNEDGTWEYKYDVCVEDVPSVFRNAAEFFYRVATNEQGLTKSESLAEMQRIINNAVNKKTGTMELGSDE